MDALAAKLREDYDEQRAALIAAEQFGDIHDHGPTYAEQVLQNAIDGDYETKPFEPAIDNQRLMAAYEADPKYRDMLKVEIALLPLKGLVHGFMNNRETSGQWTNEIQKLVAKKLIPDLLKDPKSKRFFGRMKQRNFLEK